MLDSKENFVDLKSDRTIVSVRKRFNLVYEQV